jgi:hypothetical protein
VLIAPSYAPKHKQKYPKRGRGCSKRLTMPPTENTLPKKIERNFTRHIEIFKANNNNLTPPSPIVHFLNSSIKNLD